jgi:hypothetical protein
MPKINKLILIHGLNNNLEAFHPLKAALEEQGFNCQQIILPGHGDKREETRDSHEAMRIFDERMKAAINGPYAVVAFSQGALYLQLWMEQTSAPLPSFQLLLAPALYIKNFRYLKFIMNGLPKFFIIISQMPKLLRRYNYLHIWEYRNLFQKAHIYGIKPPKFAIPTQILVDEKDELVDARRLKTSFPEVVELMHRPYLRGKKPGKYHILFHPEFFTPDGWDSLIKKMKDFFSAEV